MVNVRAFNPPTAYPIIFLNIYSNQFINFQLFLSALYEIFNCSTLWAKS